MVKHWNLEKLSNLARVMQPISSRDSLFPDIKVWLTHTTRVHQYHYQPTRVLIPHLFQSNSFPEHLRKPVLSHSRSPDTELGCHPQLSETWLQSYNNPTHVFRWIKVQAPNGIQNPLWSDLSNLPLLSNTVKIPMPTQTRNHSLNRDNTALLRTDAALSVAAIVIHVHLTLWHSIFF